MIYVSVCRNRITGTRYLDVSIYGICFCRCTEFVFIPTHLLHYICLRELGVRERAWGGLDTTAYTYLGTIQSRYVSKIVISNKIKSLWSLLTNYLRTLF